MQSFPFKFTLLNPYLIMAIVTKRAAYNDASLCLCMPLKQYGKRVHDYEFEGLLLGNRIHDLVG